MRETVEQRRVTIFWSKENVMLKRSRTARKVRGPKCGFLQEYTISAKELAELFASSGDQGLRI